jgi:ribonucleoside-diphosphate reductase alpha chain
MGILRVDHPDIMDFITCKEDLTQIVNFNISVAVTAKFMEAVKAGTSYDLIDPSSGEAVGQLDAKSVWNKMIDGAWRRLWPRPIAATGPATARSPRVRGRSIAS